MAACFIQSFDRYSGRCFALISSLSHKPSLLGWELIGADAMDFEPELGKENNGQAINSKLNAI